MKRCKKKRHKRKEKAKIMLAPLAFFAGVTLGFLVSPVKNGIGNNSGNNTKNYYGIRDLDDKKAEATD